MLCFNPVHFFYRQNSKVPHLLKVLSAFEYEHGLLGFRSQDPMFSFSCRVSLGNSVCESFLSFAGLLRGQVFCIMSLNFSLSDNFSHG